MIRHFFPRESLLGPKAFSTFMLNNLSGLCSRVFCPPTFN